MTRPFLILIVLVMSARAAFAQSAQTPAPPAEPDYPIIRIGVLSYVQYDAELKNRDAFNAFDLTRGYVNINGQLSKNVRFRLTPDVRRITDSSLAGTLVLRVKYAFVELDNVKAARSWVRFGAHQTPWLDFEESIDRYRVQGTMFSEREGLIPGSSDFGVGYFTPVGKYVDIQTGVYNGEGYAQTDVNKYKSAQGRLTLRPFADRGIANDLDWAHFSNPTHRATSVRVESGNWLFCSDMAFQGECRVLGPGEYPDVVALGPLPNGIRSARQVTSPEVGSVTLYRRY